MILERQQELLDKSLARRILESLSNASVRTVKGFINRKDKNYKRDFIEKNFISFLHSTFDKEKTPVLKYDEMIKDFFLKQYDSKTKKEKNIMYMLFDSHITSGYADMIMESSSSQLLAIYSVTTSKKEIAEMIELFCKENNFEKIESKNDDGVKIIKIQDILAEDMFEFNEILENKEEELENLELESVRDDFGKNIKLYKIENISKNDFIEAKLYLSKILLISEDKITYTKEEKNETNKNSIEIRNISQSDLDKILAYEQLNINGKANRGMSNVHGEIEFKDDFAPKEKIFQSKLIDLVDVKRFHSLAEENGIKTHFKRVKIDDKNFKYTFSTELIGEEEMNLFSSLEAEIRSLSHKH